MTMHTSARLTPDQIELTAHYLDGVASRYSNPVVGMQVLFGRCCLASLPASRLDWEVLSSEGSRLVAAILESKEPGSLNLDPLPIIEIYQMARSQNREIAGLRELLQRIQLEIEEQSDGIRSTGRVRSIALSLTRLGLLTRLAAPAKGAIALLSRRESWFSATAAELLDMADQMMASEIALDENDSKILSLISLGELRNYRVDVGCKLLRTVFELGTPDPASFDGVDFISLQRRRDGCYGFVDRLTERPAQPTGQDLALFLPITLNAVWLFRIEAEWITDRKVPAALELLA